MSDQKLEDHLIGLHGQIKALTLICSTMLSVHPDPNQASAIVGLIEKQIQNEQANSAKNLPLYTEGMNKVISTLKESLDLAEAARQKTEGVEH